MFRRLSNSWRLVKASWAVLQADRELLVFPLVSSIGLIIVTILFAIPLLASGILQAIFAESGEVAQTGSEIVGIIITFLFYFVTYTVIVFSNSALIGAALIRLEGGDPTVGDGLRIASERFGKILGYALIAATVGTILKVVQENTNNLIGRIVIGLIGMAWNLVTYLIVPVLVVEDLSPWESVKRSGSLLKETWGEQIAGDFAIGSITGLMVFGVIIVFGGLAFVIGSPAIAIALVIAGVAVILVISLVSSALNGIYQAALYRYATTGETGEYFDDEMVMGAFKPKRKRG